MTIMVKKVENNNEFDDILIRAILLELFNNILFNTNHSIIDEAREII